MLNSVFRLNWEEILPLLKQAKRESNRSYWDLVEDLKEERKTGLTYAEYFCFGFAFEKDPAYRQSFVRLRYHYQKIKELFPYREEDGDILDDKAKFIEHFSAYRTNQSLDLRKTSLAQFKDFMARNEYFFAKNPLLDDGKGVLYLARPAESALGDFFDRLLAEAYYIVEEPLKQDPRVSQLSLNAVNTLRFVTVKGRDGRAKIAFICSRISLDDKHMDNSGLGGAFTLLTDQGQVSHAYMSYLPEVKLFRRHPITGFDFMGFQFPYIEESKAMVLELAQAYPGPLLGWDVALTETGPSIIEANRAPSTLYYQCYHQMKERGQGQLAYLSSLFGVRL